MEYWRYRTKFQQGKDQIHQVQEEFGVNTCIYEYAQTSSHFWPAFHFPLDEPSAYLTIQSTTVGLLIRTIRELTWIQSCKKICDRTVDLSQLCSWTILLVFLFQLVHTHFALQPRQKLNAFVNLRANQRCSQTNNILLRTQTWTYLWMIVFVCICGLFRLLPIVSWGAGRFRSLLWNDSMLIISVNDCVVTS